jgi:S1-C subfamily serine protease
MKDARGRVTSLGSGFFVRSDVIATNFHVIKSGVGGEAKIVAQNSRHALAGLVAADESRDLALLRTVKLTAPPLSLRTDAQPAVGDRVYVVGSPLGLEGTFSDGLVNAVRRGTTPHLLQITAPLSPGSSGGPVLDTHGNVVGIVVSSLSEGQNLNFAVPVANLSRLLAHAGKLAEFPGAASARMIAARRQRVEAEPAPDTPAAPRTGRPDPSRSSSAARLPRRGRR